MNLVIDIGNTRVKAALYKGNNLFKFKIYNSVNDILSDSAFINQAKNAIIGSVVNELDSFYEALNEHIPTLIFTPTTKIPLNNLYSSASTLGSDRLSASIGAYYLYQNSNVLVIDTGTCIKNLPKAPNTFVDSWIQSPRADEESLKCALARYGPHSVSLDFSGDIINYKSGFIQEKNVSNFSYYSPFLSGVFDDPNKICNSTFVFNSTTGQYKAVKPTNHAILLVGYGSEIINGIDTPYW